jgi:integrase
MNKHTNRIGTSLLVAVMKGKHTWETKVPPLIADGGGLYLQPREGGGGVWKYRYTKDGRPTFAGLGRLEDVSATEARRQRDILKSSLKSGGDPVRDRARDAAIVRARGDSDLATFRGAAESWAAMRLNSVTAQRRQIMLGIVNNHALPALGDLLIDDITGEHVLRLVSRLDASPTVRRRAMQVVRETINFANAARPAKDRCANPAADPLVIEAISLSKLSTGKSRPHPKMPVSDVPAFMARLWANKSVTGLGMMAIILTGLRANEALHARWPEITGSVWTIPGDHEGVEGRMKAREGKARPQRVPVTPGLKMVLDTLRELRRGADDCIFPGNAGKPIAVGSMWKVLQDYKAAGVTTHGFRSTLMDFAKTQGVPFDVREAMLHHVMGGAAGHYDYDDDRLADRIACMTAWSDHCMSAIPAEQRRLRVVA